jgi:hypothetical protein
LDGSERSASRSGRNTLKEETTDFPLKEGWMCLGAREASSHCILNKIGFILEYALPVSITVRIPKFMGSNACSEIRYPD